MWFSHFYSQKIKSPCGLLPIEHFHWCHAVLQHGRRIAQTDLDFQGSHAHHARTRSSCAWTTNGEVHGETVAHNNVKRCLHFRCYRSRHVGGQRDVTWKHSIVCCRLLWTGDCSHPIYDESEPVRRSLQQTFITWKLMIRFFFFSDCEQKKITPNSNVPIRWISSRSLYHHPSKISQVYILTRCECLWETVWNNLKCLKRCAL